MSDNILNEDKNYYTKKPIPIEISEPWEKHGDNSHVIRAVEDMKYAAAQTCGECGKSMKVHGWVATPEGGHIVCPGDRIVTGVRGEHYPIKPWAFEETYQAYRRSLMTDEGLERTIQEIIENNFDCRCLKPTGDGSFVPYDLSGTVAKSIAAACTARIEQARREERERIVGWLLHEEPYKESHQETMVPRFCCLGRECLEHYSRRVSPHRTYSLNKGVV
jgi:hypothetical protein